MKPTLGLWEHRWNCIECEKSWFLSVDLSKDRDKKRLNDFSHSIQFHLCSQSPNIGFIF